MEKTVKAVCTGYAKDGSGLIMVEGFPIPVKGLLKGEEANIVLRPQGKNLYVGTIKDLLKPSSSRVKPLCPVYEDCGGCALQHLAYDRQLVLKRIMVQNELDANKIVIDAKPTIGMTDPFKYRNKVQVSYSIDYKGRVLGGFYVEGTHQIIDIDQCFLEKEESDHIVVFFKKLIDKYQIEPYDRSSDIGSIRHVVVRSAFKTNQTMVIIVTKSEYLPKKDAIVHDLLAEFSSIKSIIQNINEKPTNVILGEKETVLFGQPFIEEELCGLRFHISPRSFFQVNPLQTEVLYNAAIDMAGLKGTEEVLDAYCGIGTIGLLASKKSKHVVGIEVVGDAVHNAETNCFLNNITNAEFYCGDAGIFLKEYSKDCHRFDAVFVDPPRSGCDLAFINALKQAKPSKIIYVSCEPSTLARDLALLKTDYDVKAVQPVDMFPQTSHVETVCALLLK